MNQSFLAISLYHSCTQYTVLYLFDCLEKWRFIYALNLKSFLKVHILEVKIFLVLYPVKYIEAALFSHSNLKLEV